MLMTKLIQWFPNNSHELVISESQKCAELGSPLTGLNSIVCDGGCLSEMLESSFAAWDTILSLEFCVSSSILYFKGQDTAVLSCQSKFIHQMDQILFIIFIFIPHFQNSSRGRSHMVPLTLG